MTFKEILHFIWFGPPPKGNVFRGINTTEFRANGERTEKHPLKATVHHTVTPGGMSFEEWYAGGWKKDSGMHKKHVEQRTKEVLTVNPILN